MLSTRRLQSHQQRCLVATEQQPSSSLRACSELTAKDGKVPDGCLTAVSGRGYDSDGCDASQAATILQWHPLWHWQTLPVQTPESQEQLLCTPVNVDRHESWRTPIAQCKAKLSLCNWVSRAWKNGSGVVHLTVPSLDSRKQ